MCEREMEYDDVLKMICETISEVLDERAAINSSTDGGETE